MSFPKKSVCTTVDGSLLATAVCPGGITLFSTIYMNASDAAGCESPTNMS